MWYEEEFKVMALPLLPINEQGFINVDQPTLEAMLNELGKQGWDVQWVNREEQFLVMNRQRQVRTQEKVDRVIEALRSRDLTVSGLNVSLPNPLSDDGRIECEGIPAVREIVRLVLEES